MTLRLFHGIIMSFLIIGLMAVGYERNKLWSAKFFLLLDTAAKSPGKSRVRSNLGNCYMILGRYDEAILEYERALALDKSNLEAYSNIFKLGDAFKNEGHPGGAAYCYNYFCMHAPPLFNRQKELACKQITLLSQQK